MATRLKFVVPETYDDHTGHRIHQAFEIGELLHGVMDMFPALAPHVLEFGTMVHLEIVAGEVVGGELVAAGAATTAAVGLLPGLLGMAAEFIPLGMGYMEGRALVA